MQEEQELKGSSQSQPSDDASGAAPVRWDRLEGFAEPGHPIYKPGKYVIRIVHKRAPGETKFVPVALVDSDSAFDDARLIAAAPELLEALRELVLYHDVPEHAQDPVVLPLLRASFDAIARAEGRQ